MIKTRIRDKKYRQAFRGRVCLNCGIQDDTVIGAHIRWGHEGGMGLKPSDDLTIALCSKCHTDQESKPGPEWWANLVKNVARRRYRWWLENA